MCLTPDINSSNSVDQLCVDTLRVWCAQLSASVVLEKPELAGNLLMDFRSCVGAVIKSF